MKKIKAFLFILGMFGLFSLTSQIKANEAPTISVELTVLLGETPGEAPVMDLDYPLGGTFSITPQAYDNHVFSHWVVNGVLRTDLQEDHIFTVKSSMKLQAVYKPVDENLHPVLFIDTNGKVLQFKVLATGAEINAPEIPPTKPASEFVGYADIKDYETLLTEFPTVTEPATYVAKYQLTDQTLEYEVKLDGVSLGHFKSNTVVTLMSEDASFKFFVDEDTNEILSYSNEYKFSMLKAARNIKTVLEGDVTYPLVSLHKEIGIREGFDSYLGHYELGEDQIFVEAGIEFKVGEELHKLPAKSYNATTNEFLFSLKQSNNPENVKTYVIYKDSEGLHTIYNKTHSSLIKLPTPTHGIGTQPRPVAHLGMTAYSFSEGADGGFTGFGYVFTNTTTNEVFTWRVSAPYNTNYNVYYTEENMKADGIVLTSGSYKLGYFAMGNGTTTEDSDVLEDVLTFDLIYYTVSFDVDGGSQVDSQSILSGQKATRPQPNPTKEGINFGGWYTDQTFEQEFDFNTTNITKDTIIYAKWANDPVVLPAPIHGIGHQPRPTAHLGIDRYSFPEGANGGFTGYAYVFTNTTTNEVFIWRVENPYDQPINVYYTEANMAADGIVLTPGKYKIQYFAMGNGTTTLDSSLSINSVEFEILQPELGQLTLTIDYASKTLSWNNVSNATSYEVYVDDVLQTGNTSPFSLEGITDAGNYMLKVIAKANGYQDRVAEVEYIIAGETTQLQAPQKLRAEGTMLTWDAVENATKYAITINDVTKYSTTNSFNLEAFDMTGEVTISVVAQGDPVYYTDSEPVEITHELPVLNPRLNAMTAGDMVHSYLQNSVDGGHYKAEFYTEHDVFKQSGFSVNEGIRFVLKKDDVVLDTLNWTLSGMIMLHTPNSATSFYGRNNLVYGETYQIEIILLADEGSNYRDSLPFVTTFVFKKPN